MAWNVLAVRNINRIVEDISDIRQMPNNYTWINRIPIVPAVDEEIMGSWEGRVVAADIIADDARAVVRAPLQFNLKQTKIPNLKHGEMINQRNLNLLNRIEQGAATRSDLGVFGRYIGERATDLVDGVYARMEALVCAMLIDTFDYDRLGIKISGATWGMPSALKVTVGVTWVAANAATAKPITDTLTIKRIAKQQYGVEFDRITLSTATLLELPSINEFKDMASLNLQISLPTSGFNAQDVQQTATIFGRLVGMIVEVNDDQTWTEAEDGTQTAARYIPDDRVILTSTAFDNNGSVRDFANAVVEESIPGLVPNMIGSFSDIGGEREGPIGYATAADPNGNPPGMILWGVAKGFPRRHRKAASAVLKVR